MYKSPISVECEKIAREITEKQDGYIVSETIRLTGVKVDKDELIKALSYDRGQYEKGYADGKADVQEVKHGRMVIEPDATVIHCNVCGWAYQYYAGLEEEWNYCPHCGSRMDLEGDTE